jgi:hypothetical protein
MRVKEKVIIRSVLKGRNCHQRDSNVPALW